MPTRLKWLRGNKEETKSGHTHQHRADTSRLHREPQQLTVWKSNGQDGFVGCLGRWFCDVLLRHFFFTFLPRVFSAKCRGRIVCYLGFPKMLVSGIDHVAPSGGSQLLLNSFIMTASNRRTTMKTSWDMSKSQSVACAMPISGKMVQLYMPGQGEQFEERKRRLANEIYLLEMMVIGKSFSQSYDTLQ